MGDALRAGAALLDQAGIEGAALEARLLLAAALHEAADRLLLDRRRLVETTAYAALLARRAAHEPLAYLTGRREFWSLDFEVSPATLIPRPDSETLIEAALAARPPGSVRSVLDLGTGTGCLLLAALSEYPEARGVGVDRNPAAAVLAARNAARLGFATRAAFLAADWAAPLAARFDLVLCNPPYIESGAVTGLMPEVAHHEPRLALDGGTDGLAAYRLLLPALPALLAPAGLAVFELGQGQAEAAGALAAAAGLAWHVQPDLAGIGRALVAQHAPQPGMAKKCVGDSRPRD